MPLTNYLIFALNLVLHLVLHFIRATHADASEDLYLTIGIGLTKLCVVIFAIRILIKSKEQAKNFLWIYWGLILGWFGDLFLFMMDNFVPLFGYQLSYSIVPEFFFLAGLASFLAGHILYVLGFVRDRKMGIEEGMKTVPIRSVIVVSTLIALYGAVVYHFLYPHIPSELKIPVFAYLVVIASMFVAAYARPFKLLNRKVLIFGALFFILSDTVLAFTMFTYQGDYNSIFIMLTYGLAQLLIASGYAAGDHSFE